MNKITVPEDRVFGGAVRFLRVDINLQIVFIDDQKIMPVPFITRFPRKKDAPEKNMFAQKMELRI